MIWKEAHVLEYSIGHLAIMALTICLVLGGGLYAARSVHSSEGFSLGGRSAGVPMIAGSIAGTCVGGGATIGTAQLAGSVGLSAVWFTIGVWAYPCWLWALSMPVLCAIRGLRQYHSTLLATMGKGQGGLQALPLPSG